MNATTFATPTLRQFPTHVHAARHAEAASPVAGLTAVPPVLEDDICSLIVAAGPLSVGDIAGGLDVSVKKVAGQVEWMLSRGTLRPDEFGRLRLWGECIAA